MTGDDGFERGGQVINARSSLRDELERLPAGWTP